MKNVKKIFVLTLAQLFLITSVRADEGMWLPLYINKVINSMKTEGCKLKPEQIYNMNASSIKDGIVHFGGFCTGEIVSNQGLIFTNHHCGFDAIANLSTTNHNYLDNGYWAKNATDEIPVPGLTASILVYMQDVTGRVSAATNKEEMIKKIISEATEGNHYIAKVESMFFGNEYYLMVHEVFKDIRFVGAPPSAIGKFGGDTDNWMWPRHTGDFSVFRIYSGTDNNPSTYSIDNRPYVPKYFFPINLKGIQPNDFVMIMGYPGRTTRYLSGSSIESLTGVDYPERATVLKTKLDMWSEEMEKDVDVRLFLASDYARQMNAQKYYEGAINAIKQSPCMVQKKLLEEGFTVWVNADSSRKIKYGYILSSLDKLEKENANTIKFAQYMNSGYHAVNIATFGRSFQIIRNLLLQNSTDQESIGAQVEAIRILKGSHFDGFEKMKMPDQKVMAAILRLVQKNLEQEYWIKTLSRGEFIRINPKNGTGDQFDQYAELVYSTTMLADSNKLNKFLENPTNDALEKDLGILYSMDLLEIRDTWRPQIMEVTTKRAELMKVYLQGLKEYQSTKFMYPDANSTLRLTYGQVKPYSPRDGMIYNWYTTSKGILDKEIPNDDEFHVPAELKTLLVNKDFGRYVNKHGELSVCFLANLDITGGNSGSPVINGKGELVGIAFDGVWEGMVGDIYFDENRNRTISVDIRYVIFIIDKMAKADRILGELKLIQ